MPNPISPTTLAVRVVALGLCAALVAAACSSPARPGDAREGATAEPTQPDPQEADPVADVLAQLAEDGFSGVVLVDRGGDVTTEGFGLADREQALANSGDTVFDIGSLTKQFTGAAVLRLEMDGMLSVDDALGSHVDGLDEEKRSITLHQLLTHTAGLPGSLGDDYAPIGRDEYIGLVADTPLLRAPGSDYEYSNVGYSLLAAVIESVTGGSYEAYLREHLFGPAGMQSTGYVLPDWDDHVVAVGYDGQSPLGRPHEQPWDEDGPFWHLRGNGGLLSTAEDMHRWHEALQGDAILDASAKGKYYGRHTTEGPDATTYYGYGWAIFPTPFDTDLITHNGGNGIFFADFLRFLEEDVTVFLATNAAGDANEDAAFDLAGAVLGVDLTGPSCGPPDDADLTVLAGFPDTEAGDTATEWFAILEGGDAEARLAFVRDRVADDIIPGATVDQLADGIRQLQEELGGLTIDEIGQEDPLAFHVSMSDPAGAELIVSVRMSETDHRRIACVEVAA